MNRISLFCQKQASLLLKNELYAWFFIAILAAIPFFEWISLAIIALITLRKSSYESLKCLGIGVCAISLVILFTRDTILLPYENYDSLITVFTVYIAALALRYTVNLNIVISSLLMLAIISIITIHFIAPNYIIEQYQLLVSLFQTKDSSVLRFFDTKLANKDQLANYLLGVKALTIIISALSSLLLARLIQDRLYYPGGFRKEILNFQANKLMLLMLVISVAGAYKNNLIAISCLPLLIIFTMMAGMSLLFTCIPIKRDWMAVFFLIVPLTIIPYIALPVYVFVGSLDSLINFRLRLSQKQVKANKG